MTHYHEFWMPKRSILKITLTNRLLNKKNRVFFYFIKVEFHCQAFELNCLNKTKIFDVSSTEKLYFTWEIAKLRYLSDGNFRPDAHEYCIINISIQSIGSIFGPKMEILWIFFAHSFMKRPWVDYLYTRDTERFSIKEIQVEIIFNWSFQVCLSCALSVSLGCLLTRSFGSFLLLIELYCL